MQPGIPENEEARLDAIEGLHILDTRPEHEYDELAHLAARICGTSMAMINIVANTHVWAKANVGFPERTTTRKVSADTYVIAGTAPVVIPDTYVDERTNLLPMVIAGPKIRFYAGVPLVLKGRLCVGTLCVLDQEPRNLTLEQLGALQTLARQVVAHLELRRVARPGQQQGGPGTVPKLPPSQQMAGTELLVSLAEQVPAIVWATDIELRFTAAFGAAAEALQMHASQILGKTLYDYFGTQDATFPPIAAHLRALRGESPGPMRWKGYGRTLEVHLEPLRGDGDAVIGTAGVALDITERARMEETVFEAEARVRAMAEAASGVIEIAAKANEEPGSEAKQASR